jgi:hypothetical protein
MNVRLVAAAAACVYALGIAAPTMARAQEIRVTSPIATLTPIDGRLGPAARDALVRSASPRSFPLQDPTEEIRLSRGAKTAIIVTAIVVGALIIVGVVVLAKPGKHLP